MLARVGTYGVIGLEAYPIEVEVDVSGAFPAITIVGLADASIRESRERIKSAIRNSGFQWPSGRITINLAPCDVKKEGSGYDLAIAIGVLAASNQLRSDCLTNHYFLGELSLDGSLRPARGILPIAVAVSRSTSRNLVVPATNAREAGVVPEISAWPVKSLLDTVCYLDDPSLRQPFSLGGDEVQNRFTPYAIDFSDVKGQHHARRALEVAVAGGHNILMIGPPGSGKTMLAMRIPTIMPDLSVPEALQVTTIYSVCGTLPPNTGLITQRQFRMPHHTISYAAMAGGGSVPQPGEISLAHHGVLFLDELPEFRRDCLEVLRQPLEEGVVRISRVKKALSFPASFMLVCAMNPCPCGYLADPRKACRCNTTKIANYVGKVSGPLLDRIDIHVEVPAARYHELSGDVPAESSRLIKGRVDKARAIQEERFRDEGIFCNAQMSHRQVRKFCVLGKEENELLRMAMAELGLSARAYDKILKVARTIGDLASSGELRTEHLAEAIQYRSLDRNL